MSEAKVGVANPYALAEIAIGRKVNWRSVANPEAFVEKTLGASIDALCAPVEGNLIVSGSADSQSRLAGIMEKGADAGLVLRSAAKGSPMETMLTTLAPEARERVVAALVGTDHQPAAPGFTPPGAEWVDPGDFFEETAELFDPVQGGLGDCYFIAALAAVAWSRPYLIAQRTRATGAGQSQFVDRIDFFSNGAKNIEVSERVPLLKGTHAWIYARSSEVGEIWPAVYEKAFAKWKTNDPSDEPAYASIAGGWPVQATVELTNLTGVVKTCADLTADQIWTFVRQNCASCRTFNPMTAWTFCVSPAPVNYAGTGLVGYHAYTILGWATVNNTRYIVIRNPWGTNGPVINGLAGQWSAYDISFWRQIPLNSGGVFAIPVETFKTYYWQFGWAS